MLDLRFIRENPDLVRKAIQDKGDKADLDRLLALDVTRREIIGAVENARAQQNKVTQQIAEMKKARQDATAVIAEMRGLSDQIRSLDDKLKGVEEEIY
ncbi:MAG TPA: serine--tRNA ligase, partial [bacterium]|nr:serine--tRNA ligase [bacterium]